MHRLYDVETGKCTRSIKLSSNDTGSLGKVCSCTTDRVQGGVRADCGAVLSFLFSSLLILDYSPSEPSL